MFIAGKLGQVNLEVESKYRRSGKTPIKWNKVNDLYPVYYILCIHDDESNEVTKFFVSEILSTCNVNRNTDMITITEVESNKMEFLCNICPNDTSRTYKVSVAAVDSNDNAGQYSERKEI